MGGLGEALASEGIVRDLDQLELLVFELPLFQVLC